MIMDTLPGVHFLHIRIVRLEVDVIYHLIYLGLLYWSMVLIQRENGLRALKKAYV